MVNKVPSMQVLIGDIGELIVYSHLERRIFAVNLISELARKVGLAYLQVYVFLVY